MVGQLASRSGDAVDVGAEGSEPSTGSSVANVASVGLLGLPASRLSTSVRAPEESLLGDDVGAGRCPIGSAQLRSGQRIGRADLDQLEAVAVHAEQQSVQRGLVADRPGERSPRWLDHDLVLTDLGQGVGGRTPRQERPQVPGSTTGELTTSALPRCSRDPLTAP